MSAMLQLVMFLAVAAPEAGDRRETRSASMEEPLVTDRPDFTESTEAVPAGHLQIEAGYTFTFDRESDIRVRDHTSPELLARVGVIDDFELRIGWDGYSWTETQRTVETDSGRHVTREQWSQGAQDLSLGLKYKLVKQTGYIPHFGVIADVTVPSGSSGVSSGDVDPRVILLWAYDLTDRFAVAGNVGLALPSDEPGRFFQTTASLSGAVALSDRWGAFIEYFGLYPNAEDSDAAHSVDGGLTYLINNNLQLDVRIGAGLNEEADDFFAGAGFAWRF